MKITKDCYVNVKGWTEEEVKKAAEIFGKQLDCEIDDVDHTMVDYDYLYLSSDVVFVGRWHDLQYVVDDPKELTKEQVFSTSTLDNNMNTSCLTELSSKHNLDISICNGSLGVIDLDDPDCRVYEAKDEEEWLEIVNKIVWLKERVRNS